MSISTNSGFAVVMAENPPGVRSHLGKIPGKRLHQPLEFVYNIYIRTESWDDLCPIYDSLSTSQLGALNAEQQAENLTTALLPN